MDSSIFKSYCINRGLCFVILEALFTKMKYLVINHKGANKLAGVGLIRTFVIPVVVFTQENVAPGGGG